MEDYSVGPFSLYDYQKRIYHEIRSSVGELIRLGKPPHVIIQAPCASGKCLGRGTPVLMYDGKIKPVEDVRVGDVLIGPDSRPRSVLSVCRGREEMFRVTPKKGDSYVVNRSHILSLRPYGKTTSFGVDPVNVPVEKWLSASNYFRSCHQGWRSPVEWDERPVPLEPYFLGLWLGDGSCGKVEISKPDVEVFEYLSDIADRYGLRIWNGEKREGKCPNWRIVAKRQGKLTFNPILNALDSLGVLVDKHIPHLYMANSRAIRLQILAGLMDSDGHYTKGGYDFISKSKSIAEGVAFLCRSVGLAAYVSECQKGCQGGFVGTYHRVSISGECWIIPCKIKRKRCHPYKRQKNALNVGIKIESIGEGDYFGFQIDGDGLFLLGDFTVTHNTITQAFIAKQASLRDKRFMFIVAGRSLVSQTSEAFMECDVRHGILMADSEDAIQNDFAVHNQKSLHSCQSIIASRETYGSRVLNKKIIDDLRLDVICVDEAHAGFSGDVYQRIFKDHPDKVILLFTATPVRGNGKGLGAPFQRVIHGVTHAELLEGGYIVPPVCYGPRVVDMSGVPIDHKTGDFVQSQAEKRWDKDELHGDLLRDWKRYAQNRPTVCFAQGVEHSKHIAANFNGHGIPAVHIDADTDIAVRKDYYDQLARGDIKLISNYGVMAYGVNVKEVGCCMLARSMGSLSVYLQTTGRAFRSCNSVYWMDGKAKPDAIIIDFGGNIKKHGWPQLDRYWPLDADETVEEFTAKKREEKKEPPEMPLLHCSKCGCEWLANATKKGCPNCGYKKEGNGLATTFNGEELVRIKKAAAAKPIVDDQKAFAACLGICANTGRSLGQAIAIFERKHSKRFSKSNAMPIENYTEVKRMMGEGRSIAEIMRMPVSKVIPGFARKKKSVASDDPF